MNTRWICHLSGALLISTLQGAKNFWDEIPLSPSTTLPSVVLDDYWNSEFQRVNREVAAAPNTRLVFFGDSITWSWSLGPATGREIWENQFKDHHPINMGNSGDITPVMLHRVTRGNLDFPDGRHPKVAVILCGINNFGVSQSAEGKEKWDLGADCPPEDIANGQRAIAQVFRRRLPQTRVIMMALLPVADRVILANKSEAGPLTDGIIKNIGRVITALRLKNAKVKIVIAQNLPVKGSEETCVLLNQKISRLARSSASTLSPVVFAEANQRFELHHDMGKDDALPNAGGARKIAGTLSNAINTMLGPSSNPTAPSHGND